MHEYSWIFILMLCCNRWMQILSSSINSIWMKFLSPVSIFSLGSFSRTAVNFSAGCKTTVSNIVMAITVFIALQLLTKLLYYTPITILASIILSALPGLIDLREACNIWEVDKMDFLASAGAFFGVLFGSVEIGLSVAIIISFTRIILNLIWPRIEILGRIQGTEIFCSIRQYSVAVRTQGLLITRINSCFLCFMNANYIRERLQKIIQFFLIVLNSNSYEYINYIYKYFFCSSELGFWAGWLKRKMQWRMPKREQDQWSLIWQVSFTHLKSIK